MPDLVNERESRLFHPELAGAVVGDVWTYASRGAGGQWTTPISAGVTLPLTITNGGTGAATAPAALANLGGAPLANPVFTGTVSMSGNGSGVLPASVTNGWAVSSNYAADKAVDLWNTQNDGVGFNFRQKTAAGTQRYIAQLYNDAGTSELDFYLGGSAVGGVGGNATATFIYGSATGSITVTSNATIALQTATGVIITNVAGTPPTGGGKGVGTLNATAVYANNVLLTSDVRLKEKIAPVPDGCLELVEAIVPKSFRHQDADHDNWGFIAQEVKAAMPAGYGGHVTDAQGNQYLSHSDLVAVLWKAVRELSAEVACLKEAKR